MKRLIASALTLTIAFCGMTPARCIYSDAGSVNIIDSISTDVRKGSASNPVISRGVPAYTGGSGNASAANDSYYYTSWSSAQGNYLAYDLSSVPETQKNKVIAVWYNNSTYDNIGMYVNKSDEPQDYTIEVNKAGGGKYPESGWEIAETVKGNTYSSRQHLISMKGYNWIRLNVSKAENGKVNLNFDVHNASDSIDSWIFFGDSITAGGMGNAYGTGFATYVNQLDSRYYPVQENGGIGGITSRDGRNNIDKWLGISSAKYVSIAYGTNDCWGNPNNTSSYYDNTKYMIDAILKAGKVPVLPKIPYSVNSDVGSNVGAYNAMIDKLYAEYGDKLVHGPDFEQYFKNNTWGLSSDGVHPNSEGYDGMRKLWAETMMQNVYSTLSDEPGTDSVKGDVNKDGEFGISDVVCTQKWLLGSPDSGIADWKAGDLYEDDVLDVFDLCMMKKLLINESSGETDTDDTEITFDVKKYMVGSMSKGDKITFHLEGTAGAYTNGGICYANGTDWVSNEWEGTYSSDGKLDYTWTAPKDISDIEFQIWWAGLWNNTLGINTEAQSKMVSMSKAESSTQNPNTKGGFYADGDTIRDANGQEFIMRGVNIPYAWFKNNTEQSIKAAAAKGTNTLRIVCEDGVSNSKTTADELEKIIGWCRKYKQIAILEVHDATGKNSVSDLLTAANYWTGVKDVLNANKDVVILNIANEWYGEWSSSEWADGYKQAIKIIRNAGIDNMLMVDSAGWGQYAKSIGEKGKEVAASDPNKNVVFSIHFYGSAGGNALQVRDNFTSARSCGAPIVVGEFGYKHSDGDVDEAAIMSYCDENDIGYLAWSWKGNGGGVEYLDLVKDWDGYQLTEWGEIYFNAMTRKNELASVYN